MDRLMVEKLASRIRAWLATGVERTPEAEALDYIEFVTSHQSNKHLDAISSEAKFSQSTQNPLNDWSSPEAKKRCLDEIETNFKSTRT